MNGKLSILCLLMFIVAEVNSQHLVGLSRNEVVETLRATSYVPDNSATNTTFNYLKYVDRFEEKTLLVFMSKDDFCTSTRMMADYSSYKSTLNEFNKKYRKISQGEWQYDHGGKTYKVTLKKEEWFYSVFITTKSN